MKALLCLYLWQQDSHNNLFSLTAYSSTTQQPTQTKLIKVMATLTTIDTDQQLILQAQSWGQKVRQQLLTALKQDMPGITSDQLTTYLATAATTLASGQSPELDQFMATQQIQQAPKPIAPATIEQINAAGQTQQRKPLAPLNGHL